VELDASKVSGLVHISQLANDYYHFDATRKLLKGERTGAQFRLGDHVRIQVLRASLEDRKIDFRLVAPRATAAPVASKAYDYAASGERYSLPKAAAAKTPGMFGRAAKAIGRAFGRKEVAAPPAEAAPAAASEPARRTRQQADTSQHPGPSKKAGNASARRPRKQGGEAGAKRETAAAAPKAKAGDAPKRAGSGNSGRRRSKPKPKGQP
jgi:ribonuclease R